MTKIAYGPLIAYDPTTGQLVPDAEGQVYAITDTAFTTPLAIQDLSGVGMSTLRTSRTVAMIDEFQVDDLLEVNWKSGAYVIRLTSFKGLAATANAAVAAAQVASTAAAAASTAAGSSATAAAASAQQVADYIAGGGGGGGGGLPAGTTLEQIPNGSTRLAMTANERTKLAGVAAGATALVVGTTAGTAKSGDYAPTAADVGAPRNVSGFGRVWGRTAAQGFPSGAEGAVDGDWLFMDGS